MRNSTRIHPSEISSLSSFSSDIEVLVNDLIKNRTGLCNDIALTVKGKRKQLIKMTMDGVKLIEDIGTLVYALQNERDTAALFLSAIGPDTMTSVRTLWKQTDQELDAVSKWPAGQDLIEKHPEFMNKSTFQLYLSRHRQYFKLTNKSITIYSEIKFYSDIIDYLFVWLRKSVIESGNDALWQKLVSYLKIILAQNEACIERVLGIPFFAIGGFTTRHDYAFYMKTVAGIKVYLSGAVDYSVQINSLQNSSNETVQRLKLNEMRHTISRQQQSTPSVEMAEEWFTTTSHYILSLTKLRQNLSVHIKDELGGKIDDIDKLLIFSCFMALLLMIITPVKVKLVIKIVNDMQRFVLTLVDKTKELSREKKRTDSLLYEMLPKMVAETLKRRKDVDAEYFQSVSVMFTGIVDFDKICGKISPIQTVDLLGKIYSRLDALISKYNAYKVETVGSKYMVTSGLPQQNLKHALELALVALDILDSFETFTAPVGKIWLQIGINSGPCVAGVVGTTLPRYCVFGDTVNTASRIESNSLPNRIHISLPTQRLLKRTGKFEIMSRGDVYLKGKGNVSTFWLVGFKKDEAQTAAYVMRSLHDLLGIAKAQSSEAIASENISGKKTRKQLPQLPEVDGS
ncbi:uncharacterized protein LOC141900875 [Tubulanus polymorphus]|uniref:uncharacterized protein LOC141900875 n=1 Tax=Tubulanus polymorphus TaxID=672921 RepID=UPI003DA297D3